MIALEGTRVQWLAAFGDGLYGPIPKPRPVSVKRTPLPDAHAVRLKLDIDGFAVDACLWLPTDPKGIVAGLDFIGPIGSLTSEAFPVDPEAIVALPAWRGSEPGPLDESLRGAGLHRVPIELILDSGWGVLTACYGSFVPDHPEHWRSRGLAPLLGEETPAISLWAWALSRLVDVAIALGHPRVALFGHSRLGKAALWAAANDPRVAAVLSNDSGCAGAALEAHHAGETRADLRSRFPHWVLPERPVSVDQHQLLAAIAPRGLYVASAADDDWADPLGEYLALQSAAPPWGLSLPEPMLTPGASLVRGSLGWHLRPGGHELLPYDWRRYLAFLNGLFP